MKLVDAIDLGKECGLETVGECILNIDMHSPSLFSYTDVNR